MSVADSGPGIAPDEAQRIFDPFYSTKGAGLGVGLSICRAIIEAHGGRLSLAPNAGGGSVFRFTLPAMKAGVSNMAEPTVFIVDDDEAVLDFDRRTGGVRRLARGHVSLRAAVSRQLRSRAARMPRARCSHGAYERSRIAGRAERDGRAHPDRISQRPRRRRSCGQDNQGRRRGLRAEALSRAATARQHQRRAAARCREPACRQRQQKGSPNGWQR